MISIRPPHKKVRPTDRNAWSIVAAYVIFGGLWIVFSDKLLFLLIDDPHRMTAIQTFKGWFFILCTAAMLFALLNRQLGRLNQSERFLAEVIDAQPDALFRLGEDLCVTHVNSKGVELLQMDEGMVVGADFLDLRDWSGLTRETVLRAMRSHRGVYLELPRDGQGRILSLSFAPLSTMDIGLTVRVQDVTEQLAQQEEAIKNEKMSSMGGLAANMAHEINNPLSIILQAAQGVQRRLNAKIPANEEAAHRNGISPSGLAQYLSEREVDRYLEGILSAAKRASAIIRRMLDFASGTVTLKTAQDLNTLLQDAWKQVSTDLDMVESLDVGTVHFEFALSDTPVEAEVIRSEIVQAMANVLRNAVQAVVGQPRDNRTIHLRTRAEGDLRVVEIEDNGTGMDESTRRRAIDPFFTTRGPHGGAGLGLSTAYFIVHRNHGGDLSIESEPGRGTRVIMSLPSRAAKVREETGEGT